MWEERGAQNRTAQSCWEEKQLLLKVQCSSGKSKITGWGNQDNSSGMGHSYGMTGVWTAGLGLGYNGILGWGKPWGSWPGIVKLGGALMYVSRECYLSNLRLGKATVQILFTSNGWGKKALVMWFFSVTIFNFLISTLINLLTLDNYLYLDLKHNMLKHWYCILC